MKLPWARKRRLWVFEKDIFQFFANVPEKLKSFSRKVGQSVKIYWNQNFVIRTFLDNLFGASLSLKTNVLSVWRKHIWVFCKFLSDEVQTVPRESGESVKIYLNPNLVRRNFLEMVLEQPWGQKRMFWTFEKGIFQFFANFWVKKLKPFSEKVGQSLKIYRNQNLIIRTFLENGLEGVLSPKANVLSVWKEHFSNFWKFLSDKVETIFWESEAKRSKLFN